ncbi:hypothetical protein RirG_031470 [Rhizophagus irregularis DAOM 197198w]|uniref:Uncharacterized protein n=1 Tax=Rhizophagus irregularis (strain DAOM 197198w) TaxID=1432141 RepID=A0A015KAK8_RHIIW|nr:hypothetical protein RirG_031470 [Rhizophagus irregularis DAOM 197198w]
MTGGRFISSSNATNERANRNRNKGIIPQLLASLRHSASQTVFARTILLGGGGDAAAPVWWQLSRA